MDGSYRGERHPLCVVVAKGGDFNSLRLRVQEWVRENASLPCRTEVTPNGFLIHYADRKSDMFHHVYVSSVGNMRHEEYAQAYNDCGW